MILVKSQLDNCHCHQLSAIIIKSLVFLLINQVTTSCHYQLTQLTRQDEHSSSTIKQHQVNNYNVNDGNYHQHLNTSFDNNFLKKQHQPQQQQQQQQQQQLDNDLTNSNISEILLKRFHYLFPAENLPQLIQSNTNFREFSHSVMKNFSDDDDHLTYNFDGKVQSSLENRKIEDEELITEVPLLGARRYTSSEQRPSSRSFFRVLNKVFSRFELPEVYPKSNIRNKSGHCGVHIGCIEEIPNFPSLLKKANVSSSFTIYSANQLQRASGGGGGGGGLRIPFEPIIHYQLQDINSTQFELENNPTSQRQNQKMKHKQSLAKQQARRKETAVSWRSATNIIHSQEYPFDLSLIEQSALNPNETTRIIVGGYFAKEDEEWIDEVVRQWLLLEPKSNVIKVSWAEANRGLYHTAAYNSRIVGRQLTLFLHYLDQIYHIDLNKFHLVGHSLGAHIAGFVGADNDGKIARITGLDPAGPIFVELNPSMRLDPSDAKFVDVVHTNGGTITKGALGLSTPSGHVDYYCNGGSLQPGCYFSSVSKSIMDPVERVACSHRRSYRYFIEIIKMTISEQIATTNLKNTNSKKIPLNLEDQERQGVSQEAGLSWLNNNSSTFQMTNFSSNQGHEDLAMYSTGNGIEKRSGEILNFIKRSITAHLPKAFLFEAKQEELVRLAQPEIVLLSPSSLRRELSDLAPLKHPLEFHLLHPEFPVGKRGMYFFKTRSEPPFFASKQYALTIKTDTLVKRKIALIVRIEQTVVAEVELDEIPFIYTIPFTPNDSRLVQIDSDGRAPNLYLMWKHRSFNLLQLNQQAELHLTSIELSLLEGSEDSSNYQALNEQDQQSLVKYGLYNTASQQQHHHQQQQQQQQQPFSNSNLNSNSNSNSDAASTNNNSNNQVKNSEFTLHRNQWYRFEGKLIK